MTKSIFVGNLSYSLFKNYSLHSKIEDVSCFPFFILCTGRNGSTLLSMILNGHSKLFIPQEQYALHYALLRFKMYNFTIWRDIVKLVIGEFADNSNTENWNTNFNDLYTLLNNLPKSQRSFQKIIDEIIKEHARQEDVEFQYWGDKSIPTLWYLKHIFKAYPSSKYIFLVRDGRDVVNSFHKGGKEVFNDMADVRNAALRWKDSISKWNWLKTRTEAKNLHVVYYESLVKNPEDTVKKIAEFIGVDFESSMLNIKPMVDKRNILRRVEQHKLSEPINSNSVDNWKKELDINQLNKILPIIEEELREFGYL